jgi:hypothetical protein
VQSNVVFEHFRHETVDAATDVGQKHENVRAIIGCGERALDGVDLPANTFDASNQLQFFFVNMWPVFLDYILGVGYETKSGDLWETPGFFATYIACVGAAAAIVLIPDMPLQLVIISVQVFAGLILPSAIIFLQLLLNDHALLGDRWVNRPWNNWINWTIIVVLFALSLLLAAQVMLPKLFA